MNAISIKAKVITVSTCCLLVGGAALVGLVRDSYHKNVEMVAASALHSAQKTFDNLKGGELGALTLASTGLANLQGVRELFVKRDRDALYNYVTPTFNELKALGAGFVLFLEPDGKVFLRMHAPKNFGDSVASTTYVRKAIETQATSEAVDLVRPGFATGSCRPFRDETGKLIGYIIVSGTFDKFLIGMKQQTADDYILIGYKKFLDEKLYRNSQKAKGLADTWDQFPNVVVLGKTIEPYAAGHYENDLEGLSTEGKLIGQGETDEHAFIRGVFPLYDAVGTPIGGIFLRHDITALYKGMRQVQSTAVFAIALLMILLSVVMALMLNRLVFLRLKRTMEVATRVVGGEFSKQIVPAADDEVGKLELLFEQFRSIFVGVVDDLSKLQEQADKKSA
jgi:HAMP domain-containing protein